MADPTFGLALTCMDGRIQTPVNEFLQEKFGVDVIDVVSEPGIVKFLAGANADDVSQEWLKQKADISTGHHHSNQIAIVAHESCAGNPVTKDEQLMHLRQAKMLVQSWYPNLSVVNLWVEPTDSVWQVTEIIA